MKLDKILTEMSDTYNFEMVVTQTWMGLGPKRPRSSNEMIAVKVAESLRKVSGGPRGKKAEHIGSSDFGITAEYAKWGGKDTTPKTDVILGGQKISIKKRPNSQLMSGAQGDARAVVMTVLEKNARRQKLAEEVGEIFEDFVVRGVTRSGSVERNLKLGRDQKILEADEMHKRVSALLNERFSENKRIYAEIIQEAISGRIKFGKSSKGAADFVLAYTADKNPDISYNSVDDKSYLNKLAGKAKIRVKFKSTPKKKAGKKAGRYTYNTVLGIMLNKMNEIQELEYRRNVLKESINEGILKDIWNKIKSVVSSVVQYLKASFYNVLAFFEMEPDIEFDNTIDFA